MTRGNSWISSALACAGTHWWWLTGDQKSPFWILIAAVTRFVCMKGGVVDFQYQLNTIFKKVNNWNHTLNLCSVQLTVYSVQFMFSHTLQIHLQSAPPALLQPIPKQSSSSTNCHFHISVCAQIRQMRHNVLFRELELWIAVSPHFQTLC